MNDRLWVAPEIVPALTYADVPRAAAWIERVLGFRERSDARLSWPGGGIAWFYALQVFGDSWSLLIIRDLMFDGKRTYADFAASDEQISTSVLANRLGALVEAGIIRREGSGRATRYSLTHKGLDLLPLMVDIILWSAKYDPDTAAPSEFVRRGTTDRESLLSELEAKLREEHGLGSAAGRIRRR